MPIILQAAGLAVERDARRVFENLSFAVERGQALHVSGRNGAGKTTLLRTLCGLIRPETGLIEFEGVAVKEDFLEYLRHVTYIGHDNGLKLELTPLENLKFERMLRNASPAPTDTAILERLGVGHCAEVPCRYLSAGQKRRTALTRLPASGTRLWLLDEPLNGLDSDGRQLFEELLEGHLRGGGGAIVTSHQPFGSGDVAEVALDRYMA